MKIIKFEIVKHETELQSSLVSSKGFELINHYEDIEPEIKYSFDTLEEAQEMFKKQFSQGKAVLLRGSAGYYYLTTVYALEENEYGVEDDGELYADGQTGVWAISNVELDKREDDE